MVQTNRAPEDPFDCARFPGPARLVPTWAATAQMNAFGAQEETRIASQVEPEDGSDSRVGCSRPGSGGPGGDFDWCIPAGQTVVLDTSFSLITGGPHCTPTTVQQVIGAWSRCAISRWPWWRVEVLRSQPVVVFASGSVYIQGKLDASGTSSPGVLTLNTNEHPRAGCSWPGWRGTGAPEPADDGLQPPSGATDSASSTRRTAARRGGETGWNALSASQVDSRRGAGGGGGTFARSASDPGTGVGLRRVGPGLPGSRRRGGCSPTRNPNGSRRPHRPGRASRLAGRGPAPSWTGTRSNDFHGFGSIPDRSAHRRAAATALGWRKGASRRRRVLSVGIGGHLAPSVSTPTGDERVQVAVGGGGR